jgi:N-methylhydantoinase B/oxoprolinase/acetone carboxylase alpha subunit
MALTLYQTTRSPLFNQGDFSVGFMDPEGNMIEQDEHLALLAFSLYPGCQAIRRFFGNGIEPGDVFIHNDVLAAEFSDHRSAGLRDVDAAR